MQASYTRGMSLYTLLGVHPVVELPRTTQIMPKWRNGRRCGLKIHWQVCREGSNPFLGTNIIIAIIILERERENMRYTQLADGVLGKHPDLDLYDAAGIEYYELEKLIRLVQDLGHDPKRLKSMQDALQVVSYRATQNQEID